jgi:hypothetical protein
MHRECGRTQNCSRCDGPAAAPISCSRSAAPSSTVNSVPASVSCSMPKSIPSPIWPWLLDPQSLGGPFIAGPRDLMTTWFIRLVRHTILSFSGQPLYPVGPPPRQHSTAIFAPMSRCHDRLRKFSINFIQQSFIPFSPDDLLSLPLGLAEQCQSRKCPGFWPSMYPLLCGFLTSVADPHL